MKTNIESLNSKNPPDGFAVADGKLPDVDYKRMKMKNLDDLHGEAIFSNKEITRKLIQHRSKSLTSINSQNKIITSENSFPQKVNISTTPWHNVPQFKYLSSSKHLKCSNLRFTEQNDSISVSPLVVPTHVVHTTPDKLAQTMRMQQRLFEMRLQLLQHISNLNKQNDCAINTSEVPKLLGSTVIHSITPVCKNQFVDSDSLKYHHPGRWIVRKRSDGSRYITRRYASIDGCLRTNSNPSNTNSNVQNINHKENDVSLVELPKTKKKRTKSWKYIKSEFIWNPLPNCDLTSDLKPNIFFPIINGATENAVMQRSRKVMISPLALDDNNDILLSVTTI